MPYKTEILKKLIKNKGDRFFWYVCLPTTSEASSNDGNITVLCVIKPTPIHTHILIHKSSLHVERYLIKLVICSSKIRHPRNIHVA